MKKSKCTSLNYNTKRKKIFFGLRRKKQPTNTKPKPPKNKMPQNQTQDITVRREQKSSLSAEMNQT